QREPGRRTQALLHSLRDDLDQAIDLVHGRVTISCSSFAIRNVTSFCATSGRTAEVLRWRTRLLASGDSIHSNSSPAWNPGVVCAESHCSVVSSRPWRVPAYER